jgi:hypothetical protein
VVKFNDIGVIVDFLCEVEGKDIFGGGKTEVIGLEDGRE